MWRSAGINLGGIAATLLGLQATVGLLVAKTLTNATANPFLSGGSGSYNPVLALDVFLVQASPLSPPVRPNQGVVFAGGCAGVCSPLCSSSGANFGLLKT